MKHTPGPWYVERKYDGGGTVAIMRDWSNGRGPAIAVHGPDAWIHAEDAGPEMVSANARLIAAAPDLLAATRELYDIVLNGMTRDYDEMTAALGRARLTIAKASGEATEPQASKG